MRTPRNGATGLLLVGALLALVSLPPAARADDLPEGFWGVQSLDRPAPAEAELMARTGVEVVRTQFFWPHIEPQGPGVAGALFGTRQYRWDQTDAWIRNLARAGIKAHATLIGSPRHVAPRQQYTPMRSEQGRRAWRHFVRAVVERYGRGGRFWAENPALAARPIDVFQIWNEQNSTVRYKPRPNPGEYATMMRIAAGEIRAADPRARIVLGGMFGTPTAPDSIHAWHFLNRLYELGVGHTFDAVGVHPYSPVMRGVTWQLRHMRRVMRNHGDDRKPIEITELGWSSDRARGADDHFFFQGPRGQARLLRQSFMLLLRNRRAWRIERILWFAWRDHKGRNRLSEQFGLVRENLSRKPAFRPYRRFTSGSLRPRPLRRR